MNSKISQTFTDALNFVSIAVTKVADFVSNGAAALYAALLPTADILNAIVTVLPAYDFNLFLGASNKP